MEKLLQIAQFLLGNKRLLGILIGVLFGVLYLIFGFFKTLVFALIVCIGYLIGRFWDDQEDWRDVIDRVLPPKFRE